MDRMKKIASLVLAVVIMVSLCSCGKKKNMNALERILDNGVLTVAVSLDYSPMEFVDTSKSGQEQYVGFDISLARYIASELGVTLKIEPMNYDACQTAVYTGSVFISISGYSLTEERANNYELSDYYYAGGNESTQTDEDQLFSGSAEPESYVIMMTKGETELLARVNEILARAHDAGYYEQWYEEALALSESAAAAEVSY